MAGTRSGPVRTPASSNAVSMCSTEVLGPDEHLLTSIPGHQRPINQGEGEPR
jgi:hypothetical protein